MVMGPTCGMVLADLGAEIIKVETIGQGRAGDASRKVIGSGSAFFPLFKRNKKSLALDLQSTQGREAVLRPIATADIVSENFKPGTMKKLGLDYASLKPLNPQLIYVSHKGFLPGPYEHRTALDEVVQMMGGLAYVTGRPGAIYCKVFELADLKIDPRLATNNDRVRARDWMLPILRERMAVYSATELSALFEENALPFAPITRPEELLDDPHLNATGALAPMSLPDGRQTKTVLLPLTLDGERLGVRLSPPKLGEHNAPLLASLGYSQEQIELLSRA